MAICMSVAAGHMHDEGCDQAARIGRTTTVISIRIPDYQARALRELIAKSPVGYDSVGDYIKHLLTTQALRRR